MKKHVLCDLNFNLPVILIKPVVSHYLILCDRQTENMDAILGSRKYKVDQE
jgi:hypothetical protein